MLQTLRKKIAYTGRHFTPTWRYGFNLDATLAYRRATYSPSTEAQKVLASLRQDGIALTSVSALLGQSPLFDELSASVNQLESDWAERLAAERAKADDHELGRKTFIMQMLGKRPDFDAESIYARFALQPAILDLANAYFGLYTQLRFYNVWHTLCTKTAPRESQLWHRDRDDHFILKLFVYLSDIDEGAGPMFYGRGTHTDGARCKVDPAFSLEGNVKRTTDEQMAAVLPRENWLTATGARGTMLFVDTSGFHKGGLARISDRLQYVCMFTSPASQVEELFTRPSQVMPTSPGFNEAQKRALGGKRKTL